MYKNQILSIFPIYNIIQIDKLYENYLSNFLNDKHWNHNSKSYIDSVKIHYFAYTQYIKKLNFDKYPTELTKINFEKFYKNFLNTIFNEISIQPYLCRNIKITKDKETIYRPNHGALNHLRSLYFTNILLIMLKRKQNDIYKDLCPTKNHEFLLLISSLFKSILRNDEGGKCSGLINISDQIIKNHFPNIAQYLTVFIPGLKITLFHLASGLLLKSIIKYLDIKDIDDEFIEMLVFGNIYYLDAKHNDKLIDFFNLRGSTAKNYEYIIGSPEHKILLIYCIVCTGHYFDHCRLGNFGGILNQPHICILRKTINTSIEEDQFIMQEVLNKLYFTEFYDEKDNLDINIDSCLENSEKQYDFYGHTTNKSSMCCKKLGNKKQRYTKRFFEISKNFNEIYRQLRLELFFKQLIFS